MERTASNNSSISGSRNILFVFKISISLCYCILFIYLLFFARRRRHLTEHFFNFKPIKGTIDNYRAINPDGNHEYFNFYCNLLGNIALFVPFSIILISLAGIYNNKKVMLITLITSITIELLQYIFYRGVADVDDILLNITGSLAGIFIYKILLSKWEANLIYQKST